MKAVAKILLALYLFLLAWLVLFKLSFNVAAAFEQQARSLNLIPFGDPARQSLREPLYNVVAFIPFGLLLSVNLKRATLWRKLAVVFAFSLAAEVLQFALAIGIADTTDLLTNTAGGLLGLLFYAVSRKSVDDRKLDRAIVVAGVIALVVCLFLLGVIFFNGIRFRSAR